MLEIKTTLIKKLFINLICISKHKYYRKRFELKCNKLLFNQYNKIWILPKTIKVSMRISEHKVNKFIN
jgi:hypothetical protein